jgi:Co/Zn/Cd efflux system component
MTEILNNPFRAAHDHAFLGASHKKNERKTWAVIGICRLMMFIEIIKAASSALWRSLQTD